MLLHGYTEATLTELRERLEKIKNQGVPIVELTPKEGVCGLDMVDISYRLESDPARAIFSQTDWFDPTTFDVEKLTVGQLLSVWDEIVHLQD